MKTPAFPDNMATEKMAPGYAEMSDWPHEPRPPFRITSFGAYRDPRPHCTYHVDLEDLDGTTFHFFFDRFLGRLCYGGNDRADDAAYLTKGSRLQTEAFAVMESLCKDRPEFEEIQSCLRHAKHYV